VGHGTPKGPINGLTDARTGVCALTAEAKIFLDIEKCGLIAKRIFEMQIAT